MDGRGCIEMHVFFLYGGTGYCDGVGIILSSRRILDSNYVYGSGLLAFVNMSFPMGESLLCLEV